MKNIALNMKYKMRFQSSWILWALAIIVGVLFLIFLPLIKLNVISENEGSLVYRLWVLIIVQFGITIKFKEDFDFLLTLSNTRSVIFQSQLGVMFVFSSLISILIILEKHIVDYLNSVLGFHNIIDPFHFLSPYSSDNIFMQFVFFLTFGVCLSLFGLLMGSLFYRFGKKFTLAFWLIFSAIPTVVFPLILWIMHLRDKLEQSITSMVDSIKYFDLASSSLILFILAILFSTAAWLNIRRLPQK